MKSLKLIFIIISAFFAIAGCTHLELNDYKSKQLLIESVKSAWDAKIRKDWGSVYDLSVDAYKKKIKRDDFIKRANLNIEKYSIKDIEIFDPGKRAVVLVNQNIKQMGFDFSSVPKEEWLWENDKWCLNLTPSTGPILENQK